MTRRIRRVGDAAVPDWVQREARRFEYPDIDTVGGGVTIGGGGGAPTIVIAASDATSESKARADYVCTGVNDHFLIQTAIDNLGAQMFPSAAEGFRILLTEGVFNVNMTGLAYQAIDLPNGTIEGMGCEATIINAGATSGAVANNPIIHMSGQKATIANLSLQGGSGIEVAGIVADGYAFQIINCVFSTNGAGVYVAGSGQAGYITNCTFEGDYGVFSDGDDILVEGCYFGVTEVGIEETGGNRLIIANNFIETQNAEAVFLAGGTHTIIEGNYMNPGTYGVWGVTAVSGVLVRGNIITFGAGSAGIQSSSSGWQVEGNYLNGSGYGIVNEGDVEWLIRGNRLTATDGISIENGGDNTVVDGNYIDAGGQIIFDGGSFDGCQVINNVFTNATTPSIDGAIVFDNGSFKCLIANNLIFDAGGMDGIRVTSGDESIIANNYIAGCDRGIVVPSGSFRMTVDGNYIYFPGEHGIAYAGDGGTIRNNLIYGASQNTNNTWDNINVDGDANLIMGNKSIPAASSPLTRYGINIVGGNDNAVYANDLDDSSVYGTADSVDAGTGTQVAPAAGVIGGQFAY